MNNSQFEQCGGLTSATCIICGSTGDPLYKSLRDRLFEAPGSWDLIRCNNSDCGLIWINPMPNKETLAKAYESYYTQNSRVHDSPYRRLYERMRRDYVSLQFGYRRAPIRSWEKFASRILALIPHRKAAWDASIMWLPAKPCGRLLEIGCGNGERLTLLKELGWHTQGIEPDLKAATIARSMGHQIAVGTLDSKIFPREHFDAILMCHVIEHVDNPKKTVRDCSRLLNSAGHLVMLTPNTEGLGHRWYGKDWLHLDPPRHINLFNQSSMVKLLEDSGFDAVSCTSVLRDANWTLGGSRALKFRGTYRFGSLPFLWRLYGLVLLYIEWFNLILDNNCGEELLVVAHK